MSSSHSIFHPDFVLKPYWWDTDPPAEERNLLPVQVDVAIVGSGYCGLAAGLDLARSGLKVAVLDSGQIGEGASTRNGGMVSGGLKVPEAMRSKLGEQRFAQIRRDSVASFAHFEDFIKRENFDVQYERCGRFTGAHSPGAYRRQERQAVNLVSEMGLTVTMVPKAKQHDEIGSDFYHGGMVVNEAGGINPGRYHRLLRDAYKKAGGSLHGYAEVKNITRAGDGYTLTTPRGTMQAKQVFMATNGYSGGVMPYFQRRIIPITSFVVTTEELSPDLISQLNPNKRMLVDTKRILYWYRLTPDHRRIIFGGRAKFSDVSERESAHSLHQFMCGIWPQLQTTKLTHAWKGNVAFTFDHLPHMGVHDGVHYAGGCQGAGVAMATYLGHQTAAKILNPQGPRCGFDSLPFPSNPLYYGKPWFLPVVGNYYKALDRLEQRTGW